MALTAKEIALSIDYMTHVYRMAPRALKLMDPAAEGDKAKVPAEVQILRAGTYHHPEYGEFTLTAEDLERMVANFQRGVRGVDLAIDYQHDNEDIAAGWFKAVALRGAAQDELWVTVDWTPKGEQVLADREFRYLSAEFAFNYQDNETLEEFGPTLLGAGLTNRPAIKRMAPAVELTEGKGNEAMKTVEQLQAEIKRLSEDREAVTSALKGKSPEQLHRELGEALEQLKGLRTENEALLAEKTKLADEKAAADKANAFNKMMSEGKAVEAQREAFLKGDVAKFAELAKPLNTTARGTDEQGGGTGGAKTKAEAEAEISKLAQAMLSEKKVSTLSEGFKRVMREQPELAKAYNSKPAGAAVAH